MSADTGQDARPDDRAATRVARPHGTSDNVVPLRSRPQAPRRRPEPLWREAVGGVLRDRRLDRDERITDVAARAGVSAQYLSELERGRKDPSSEMLAAVSGALGLSVRDVAERAGTRLAGPVCSAVHAA